MQKGMLIVTMPGMNDKAGRFINNEQVFVFVNDIEGDILRRDGEVMGFMVQQHLDDITWFDAVVGGDG